MIFTLRRLRLRKQMFSDSCGKAVSYCRSYCHAKVSKTILYLPVWPEWRKPQTWEVHHVSL